jgi:SAM-dependent methyltransferase
MGMKDRSFARRVAREHLESGDYTGWFERLYSAAAGDPECIPWADLAPNPNLTRYIEAKGLRGMDKKALKVGCGLGDDAEYLSKIGFRVLAFDVAATSIGWCKRRFPQSQVDYAVCDLFHAPDDWRQAFEFVLESYTLQVLPPHIRRKAIACIAQFVAPGGTLLVIARGRDEDEPKGEMPWPLLKSELDGFRELDLEEVTFEDYRDEDEPDVRRFRAVYRGRRV